MKHILAVCDSEETYAYQLADYLNDKKGLPFQIEAFTSLEQMEEFSRRYPLEVALVSEKTYTPDINKLPIEHLLLLNESGMQIQGEITSIYKYQATENIVKEILQALVEQGAVARPITTAGRMNLLGIYSPIGRCLQTSFAFTLGQILAKKHRVLYLNLETYSGMGMMLRKDFKTDLSDLMYYLHNSTNKLSYRMGSMVETINGMDMIPPFFSYVDLMSVTQEEWFALFREIENHCDYEYLILDLSEQVQGLFSILRQCSHIYTIVKEDGFAQAKIDQYERLLCNSQFHDVVEKTRKCSFPIFRQLPKAIEQLPFSELAGKVKEIVEEDFS